MEKTGKLQDFVRRRLKLRQLKLLLALDEFRHVGRVAEVLHVSQPAVSRTLLELEQGLGFALFLRTSKGLEPTPEGICLIRHAEAIEEDLNRAALALESLVQPDVWQVTVGIMHGAAPVIGPTMERWRQRNPGREFHLTVREGAVDTLLSMLRAGKLDLLIGAPPESSAVADLQVEPLYADHMVWVIAHDHPLATQAQVSLTDLSASIWVLPPRVSRRRALVDAALRRHRIAAPGRLVESLSHETILGFVTRQQAAALVTSRLARTFEARKLVKILDIEMGQVLQMAVVTRENQPLPPAAADFIAVLAQYTASSSTH